MNVAADFVDSNILVYAFTHTQKTERALDLLDRRCSISVQSLNEFANVARRKLQMGWSELDDALLSIRQVCSAIIPIDVELHSNGMYLARRYGFATYDSLIVAAALRAQSPTLWSEDMHHGLLVENHLRILNPFATPA